MKKFSVLLLSGVMLASSISMDSLAASQRGVNPGVGPVGIKVEGLATDPSMIEGNLVTAEPIMSKGEKPVTLTDLEPTNQGLEAAILAVKNKITIPEAYSEFNYYFYNDNSYQNSYWSLSWRNPKTNGYIQVNCDADNHITYYSRYDYSEKRTGVSKYLKKELAKDAEAFVKKLIPDAVNHIELVDSGFEGVYSGNYVYHFDRKNNQIAFPDNRITVWMNSITGEATSLSANWLYDEAVPDGKVKLTKEEAAKLIKDNMKMKLVYRSDSYGIYYDFRKPGNADKAYLVYEPSIPYISVDAKTGEVYLTKSEWVDVSLRNEAEETSAKADLAIGAKDVAFTEEEQSKIAELKQLITKSKAISIVTGNPYLHIDKNLKSYTATLNKQDNGKGDTSYVWNISLTDPSEIDYSNKSISSYYRPYAYATVDAKSGKIMSFYASVKNYYDEINQKWNEVKISFTKDEGKKILESFLNSQIPDRFKNSVISNQSEDYIAYYKNDNEPVYGGYSYNYNRTNEGVEYPNNSIYGSVDGVTGKVYSYGSNWNNNITFESTKGAMTPEEALNHYLNNEGYGLKYEINVVREYNSKQGSKEKYYDFDQQTKVKYEIRLVYRPDVTPSLISPFTGKQLDYNGSEFKKVKPYTYLDIKDTPENRNILLLADMNIGFEGEYFKADQAVSEKEMLELLGKIGYGYGAEATALSDKTISREKAAQILIERLGLEKLSKLQGIYKTGFDDEATIGLDYYGAVALAKGLGLIKADENLRFYPKREVTRIETIDLILNFLETQQNGI